MKVLSCFFLLLALVLTAAAADVTGNWSGTVTPLADDGKPQNGEPALLILKQSGETLTGTGGPDQDQQLPLQNGKVVGNTITGEVKDDDGSTFKLNLKVDGDHITGDVTMMHDGQSQKAKIDLKRVK